MVFRAIDEQTGEPVAVRRVFPFGPDAGGLQGEEKIAFDISIERMVRASHPALRSVVSGGCDPIDAVPFIVTEWIEGTPLSIRLATAPLQSRQAIEVIMRALEVSEVLSQLLAEEAVWVETEISSIIESAEPSNRGITFWVSPLKWLGTNDDRRSLKPIVQLTEDLMGWKNKLVNDQAGGGLASWLKWLKQHAKTTNLAEARETLAAATGGSPPAPTSRLVRQSTKPLVPGRATARPTGTVQASGRIPTQAGKKPPQSKVLLISIISLALLLGAGAWMYKTGKLPFGAKPVASSVSGEDPAPIAIHPENDNEEAFGPYLPGDSGVINSLVGKKVIICGVLKKIRPSGKFVYLEFEEDGPSTDAAGAVPKDHAIGELAKEKLDPLLGQRIRIQGPVAIEKPGKSKRPQILIASRKSIELDK